MSVLKKIWKENVSEPQESVSEHVSKPQENVSEWLMDIESLVGVGSEYILFLVSEVWMYLRSRYYFSSWVDVLVHDNFLYLQLVKRL